MGQRLRVGVLGAGYFAGFQIAAWDRLAQTALVAVADRDPARLAPLAAKGLGADLLPDLAAMLDAHDLDILDIATPPGTHAALIRAALGKVGLIICQKPFASDLATARVLVAEAEVAGTPLLIHENFRFQPWYRHIAGLLAEGALGDVVQARFALRPGDGAGQAAYLDRQPYFREMPRFLIRETGIHFIDTFRYLFGEPTAVYADLYRSNPVIAGEDSGQVILALSGGGRAIFDANRTLDHAARNTRLTMGEFEVEGTRASLRLTGDGALSSRARGAVDWRAVPFSFTDRDFGGDCVQAFQAHAASVASGAGSFGAGSSGAGSSGAPETAARDYLRNLEIEALIYASAERGCRLPVPEPDRAR